MPKLTKTRVEPAVAFFVITTVACIAAVIIAVGINLTTSLPATAGLSCYDLGETFSRDVPAAIAGKNPNFFNPTVKSTAQQRLYGRPYGSAYADVCLIDMLSTTTRQMPDGSTRIITVAKSTPVDSCSAADEDNITKRNCRLQEGFCTGTDVSNYVFKCPSGCSNGACITLMNVYASTTLPVTGTVGAGTSDYTFANLVFVNTTTTEMKISQVRVAVSTSRGYPANLSGSTLWDGANQMAVSNNPDAELAANTIPGGTANAVFSLSTPLVVAPGSSKILTYKADVASNTIDSAEFSAGLKPGAEPVILDSTGKTAYPAVTYFDGQKMSVCGSHTEFVAYYKFENNVSDSSGSQANGTAFNGPTYVTGKTGKAIKFDGANDYVALPVKYCANFHQISALTVCTWFNNQSISDAPYGNWAFVDFDRSEYFDFFLNENTGQLGFSTHSRSPALTHDFYSERKFFNDAQWHFGCVIYDSGKKYFYIDGQNDYGQGNGSVQTFHNGAPLASTLTRYGFIGDGSEADVFNGGRNGQYYKGLIDELRIYEKALSDAEMKYLYLTGLDLACPTMYPGIDPENLTDEQQSLVDEFPEPGEISPSDIIYKLAAG